jgi:hypothetical protein
MGIKQDRIIKLKNVCSEIAKISYADLCSEFNEIHLKKLKLDTDFSPNDINIENRIEKDQIANVSSDEKEHIKTVIRDLKDSNYTFKPNDIERLNIFANRIDFVLRGTSPSGAGLNNHLITIYDGREIKGETISIVQLYNEIKSSKNYSAFLNNTGIHKNFLTSSLGFLQLLPYFYSVVKNSQDSESFPLFYKQWQLEAHYFFNVTIFNYDEFCIHYRELKFLGVPKLLNFGNYYYLLLLKLKNNQQYIEMTKDTEEKNKIDELIFVDRKENVKFEDPQNIKSEFIDWLVTNPKNNYYGNDKTKIGKVLDEYNEYFDIDIYNCSNSNYKEIIEELDKILYKESSNSFLEFSKAESNHQPRAILGDKNYIKFLNEKFEPKVNSIANRVNNKLTQAICIIGDSGVGKTYRVNKTLENEGHKTLFIIIDNMWQHLLFDYSPIDRKYYLTKVGEFIKKAYNDAENNYTIVIDECHKNLEIINDVLLQAISTKRNDGVRFLALNSLVEKEFDFLPAINGNRVLPSNLGFLFISSKSDIIEGNDDLKNRIEIIELTESDQADKEYTIDYLLSKIKKEDQSEYTN